MTKILTIFFKICNHLLFALLYPILTLVNLFLLTLTFLNNLHQNLQPSTFRAFIRILTLVNLFLLTLTFLNNLHQNLQPSTFRAL